MKNSSKNPALGTGNDLAGSPTTDHFATDRLATQVREELLAIPYSAFLLVIARLLERQGYSRVRLLGRKGFVGRNRSGGWDLEAKAPCHQPMSPGEEGFLCIIQVKQFDDLAVQQRSVDELRGCILRADAGLGVLITTSRFSPVAQEAAQASSLAPIVLLDGDRLLTLLIQQKLGICLKPGGTWEVDLAFFHSLREENSLDADTTGAEKRQKRHLRQRLPSLTRDDTLPKKREHQPSTPPKGHVLHLSIVLNAEPGCGKGFEIRRKKRR